MPRIGRADATIEAMSWRRCADVPSSADERVVAFRLWSEADGDDVPHDRKAWLALRSRAV